MQAHKRPQLPIGTSCVRKKLGFRMLCAILAEKTRALCGLLSDVKDPVQIAADMIGIQ